MQLAHLTSTRIIPLVPPPSPTEGIFYDAKGGQFYYPRNGGGWIHLNKSDIKSHLFKAGVDKSEINDLVCAVQTDKAVDYAGPIAGNPCGEMRVAGRRILITSEATPIMPTRGNCSFILEFLQQLLRPDGESEEQVEYFLYWLKSASASLRERVYKPGQCLILCGPRECGKTLLLTLVAKIFGGRVGKPYQYMTQATTFNGELAGTEFLTIDDEVASQDIRSRRKLGQNIKSMIYGDWVQIHPKNREAFSARPWWRVAIACNDEEEAIQILPPIEDSLEDKLMAFRCGRAKLPPSDTPQQRKEIEERFNLELPHFVHYLDELVIPAEKRCERNGVKWFIHPWIRKTLTKIGPEVALAELIVETLGNDGTILLTAKELECRLLEGRFRNAVQKLLSGHSTCGKYLSRLSHHERSPVRQSGMGQGGVVKWEIELQRMGELVG